MSVELVVFHFRNVAFHRVQKALDGLVDMHRVLVGLHQHPQTLAALTPGNRHRHDVAQLLLEIDINLM